MDLRRTRSKTRVPRLRPTLPLPSICTLPGEGQSFMKETTWDPGRSDVHLLDLMHGSVTFSRFTTDIDQASKPCPDLVEGPKLASWVGLLVGFVSVAAGLCVITTVLAMLDMPFQSERGARLQRGLDPTAALEGRPGAPTLVGNDFEPRDVATNGELREDTPRSPAALSDFTEEIGTRQSSQDDDSLLTKTDGSSSRKMDTGLDLTPFPTDQGETFNEQIWNFTTV